jgi:clan AA aspartic protease
MIMNLRGDTSMGRVTVEVALVNAEDLVRVKDRTLAPDKVRRLEIQGVVDTGATWLVIPKAVAKQLGLADAGKAKVRYADRRSGTRQVVENVQVELLGRHGNFQAIVEPKREDALIGAIVLEALDLLVDCGTQTLQPRDPTGFTAEIE